MILVCQNDDIVLRQCNKSSLLYLWIPAGAGITRFFLSSLGLDVIDLFYMRLNQANGVLIL